MSKRRCGLTAILLCLATAPAAAQQTSKYSLVIISAGGESGGRRDGSSMLNMGVYPGRQECEAAGKATKFGAITGAENAESSIAVAYLCVPLGRP